MKNKINCVLLVDDDEATNFIHEHVINEADFAEQVMVTVTGKEALNMLNVKNEKDNCIPDLIFLDINMPGMTGWEFLEHYVEFDKEKRQQTKVVMLTTSQNPDDQTRSESHELIDHFLIKPLTTEMLEELEQKFFIGN